MSGFSIKYPFFIIVACLMVAIVGVVTLMRMPVDLFPPINIPVVVVATFYSGMPPQQIETDITNPFERFFTLGSGIDHIESRSLPGVSLIKIYFQAGTNADADLSTISNLAMADLRRLPPGTLPPVVLKFDASSLPVCLITLKGQGLNETQLRDLGQYTVRNQIANVPGASVPQPFGGRYRQIMVYVDPLKLDAHELSVMDVVRTVNQSNLILPAGDVKIGPYDYNLYTNSQVPTATAIDDMPLKTVGQASVLVRDVGKALDAQAIQTNIVRVDGQRSVYLPILKQGGDTNTIAVVDGIKEAISNLVDIPKQLMAKVVFDQSVFVRMAIENLLHEGAIGLVLTGLMILLFLGSMRATAAVFLSIPLSALAAFLALSVSGGTVNTMVLGGLALAFSRLIDNSVVVLENIFRHLEMGESPEVAAEKGGQEVSLAVLAATITTAIVFFPVVFLYGVSRFLFVALAMAVVLSLAASYIVAMTVVPLFCAKLIHKHEADEEVGESEFGSGFGIVAKKFNVYFENMLAGYDRTLAKTLLRPVAATLGLAGVSILCLTLYPLMGVAFFPRTDPGQFVVNIKAPSGTRVELSIDNLPRAYELGGVYTTYVLWAISPDGHVDNMGEIKRSGSGLIEKVTGVAKKRGEPLNHRRSFTDDRFGLEWRTTVGDDDPVCIFQISFDARSKNFRHQRIGEANATPTGFIFIRRADAAQSSSNAFIAEALFARVIERSVVRKNQVRARADLYAFRRDAYALAH